MGDDDHSLQAAARIARLSLRVADRINDILDGYVPVLDALVLTPGDLTRLRSDLISWSLKDLFAFADRDPAAYKNDDYILSSYATFRAIMHYRVAHALLLLIDREFPDEMGAHFHVAVDDSDYALFQIAREISEHAKATTGVEIHPAATIGAGFVIDHGVSTVIGETAVIGDDCYILQGVTLGGSAISDARPGSQRHPHIGNKVQIASHVRLFGPITIGDEVKIQAGATITGDIPSGTEVHVVCTLQICRPVHTDKIRIYGVVPCRSILSFLVPDGLLKTVFRTNEYALYGFGLGGVTLHICTSHVQSDNYAPADVPVRVVRRTNTYIRFRIDRVSHAPLHELVLAVALPASQTTPIYLTNLQAFRGSP